MKECVEEHPTCMAYDDKNNDEYLSILGQIVSGLNHLNEPGNNDSLHLLTFQTPIFTA
jgi:hypothetical protein